LSIKLTSSQKEEVFRLRINQTRWRSIKSTLTVVSSWARDIFFDGQVNVVSVQSGGPAQFICQALAKLGLQLSWNAITGQVLDVEILPVPGEAEAGRIKFSGKAQILPSLKSPNLLLSTLLNEWDIQKLQRYAGLIFLDAQGFVRKPDGAFGQKQVWIQAMELGCHIFCVKATEEELLFLPERFVRNQKAERCLIVTKGSKGSEVFHQGQRFEVVPKKVVFPADTVGAGDAFFANFTAEYILSGDVVVATERATDLTVEFLLGKPQLKSWSNASHKERRMIRRIQIGVMGSAADLGYSDVVAKLAEEVGREAALAGCTVVFGAEKDCDSLSTAAGRGARSAGGLTVGVTYGKGLGVFDDADVIITCGAERGGPREAMLVLSCDAIICISGGSGTLNEMVVAYQGNIPIVGLTGAGGWSDKLAGQYIDARNRQLVQAASTAKEAVELALKSAKQRICKHPEEEVVQLQLLRKEYPSRNPPCTEIWEVKCGLCARVYEQAFIGD
jgi:uncharacterized protein (TIGR00725 family)